MKNLIFILLVLCVGCDKADVEKLNSVAKAVTDKAAELNETIDISSLSGLQNHLSSLSKGIFTENLEIINSQTKNIDAYLDTRIWTWYGSIYESNKLGGIDAAKEKIREFAKTHDIQQYELASLDAINTGLQSNLGLKDSSVLESVAVQSLRSKFGDKVTDTAITLLMVALVACRHGC